MPTSFILSLGIPLEAEADDSNSRIHSSRLSELEKDIYNNIETSLLHKQYHDSEVTDTKTYGFQLDGLVSAEFFINKRNEEELTASDQSRIFSRSIIGIILPSHIGCLGPPSYDEKPPSTIISELSVVREVNLDEINALIQAIHPCVTSNHFLGVFKIMDRINTITDCKHVKSDNQMQVTQSFKIILLLNEINHNLPPLSDVLNGESLLASKTSVIQTILLSKFVIRGVSCTAKKSSLELSEKYPPKAPSCPVCLHRIDPRHFGLSSPKSDRICSQFCALESYLNTSDDASIENTLSCCQNRMRLKTWDAPFYCATCDTIDQYANRTLGIYQPSFPIISSETNNPPPIRGLLSCSDCQMTQTLWVCMTCGFVGCGRYTYGHASKHFLETNHPYSLELVTQRIWDYTSDNFIHRKDFLECPLFRRQALFADALNPGIQNTSDYDMEYFGTLESDSNSKDATMLRKIPSVGIERDYSHKKASMISAEYEVLLQSALEDQAMYFEALIAKMCSEFAADNLDRDKITDEEAAELYEIQNDIQSLQKKIDCMTTSLVRTQRQQASYQTRAKKLIKEQDEMKSRLINLKEEAIREQREGELKIEELEQQISDLTAFASMRQQITNDSELREAQIVSTVMSPTKQRQKLSSKRKGRRR